MDRSALILVEGFSTQYISVTVPHSLSLFYCLITSYLCQLFLLL